MLLEFNLLRLSKRYKMFSLDIIKIYLNNKFMKIFDIQIDSN